MSGDEETVPLTPKEETDVVAKAEAAGEAARLAWAKENAPIRPDQVEARAYAVAMWLLTVTGKVNSRKVTLDDLYQSNFSSRATDVHYVGYYPRGTKGAFDEIESFNRLQLERIDKSVKGLAIIIAQILCKKDSLDEVHEISQAEWGIRLPNGEYFLVTKSTTERWKQRASILRKRVSSDVFLIECMKELGDEDGLENAYLKGYPERDVDDDDGGRDDRKLKGFDATEAILTQRLLKDRDRTKKLKQKGARQETYRKAREMAGRGVRKLRKKD